MSLRLLTITLLAALPLLGGCLQRVDADLPVQGASDEFETAWKLAGTFGEPAPPLAEGADPWNTFYPPGQFCEIAGLCATAGEVWVCDLGISRVQIFDFNGKYLREVGQGNALAGTLPSDELLHQQQREGTKKRGNWEAAYGAPWIDSQGRLFKAADVVVTPAGFWLADQAHTNTGVHAKRGAGFYLVTPDGVPKNFMTSQMLWPSFIAADGPTVGYADSTSNYLYLCVPGSGRWRTKTLCEVPNFSAIMNAKVDLAGKPQSFMQLQIASNAGSTPGAFNHLGGIAFAFNKLIVCDGGNRRLQIFEGRSDPEANWGTLLRIVSAASPELGQRFDIPIDVDVAPSGLVFLLDGGRREVALLNPRLERIGSFGLGDLVDPYAVDVSDDGRHCFVTDSATNKVYHYAVAN